MSGISIIYLTDLHVSSHINVDGEVLSKDNISLLNTSEDDDVRKFKRYFINYVKKCIPEENKKYVIISGDIANEGEEEQYSVALQFFNELKDELDISPENFLIIPGNHDVNWHENNEAFRNAKKTNPDIKPYQLQSEKFRNFIEFYSCFYVGKKTFNPEIVISNYIEIPEQKLLILGINSCEKCSFSKDVGGIGYIDQPKFKKELTDLREKFPKYAIIPVTHHNPLSNYEKNKYNGFEEGNWQEIKILFEENDVNIVVFGHEHTPGGETRNLINYLSTGAFSRSMKSPYFNLFTINEENDGTSEKLELRRESHKLEFDGNKHLAKFYSWSPILNDKYVNDVTLREQLLELSEPSDTQSIVPEMTTDKEEENEEILDVPQSEEEKDLVPVIPETFEESLYHAEIFKIVKELKIFKTGHFHWSDDSRAHNWIDVPKLLHKKEHIFLAQKAILNTVRKYDIHDIDQIIGLGMEGNILALRTVFKLNKPYTFLPYSYRHKDHDDYEKEIKNNDESFRPEKILIITDVVSGGKTITNLFSNKGYTNFFSKLNEVYIVSLFYTGKTEDYSVDMINKIKKEDDAKNYHFHFISKITVEKCPYTDADWETKCDIYCEKLDEVHEFYNKE